MAKKEKTKSSGMKALRRKIVVTFLIILVLTSVGNGILDILIEMCEPYFVGNDLRTFIIVPIFAVLMLLNYVVGGLIFYLIIRKALRKESDRQIRENSLMYAAVAHDLKTPLTSVSGFADALSSGRIPEEEKEEIYAIISQKSKSMNQLVDLLFEYSELGSEQYRLNLSEFDGAALVRQIVAEQYVDLEEHEIEVDVDIPEEPILISADRREVTRALTNLIVNTYKHNPAGISLSVKVRCEGDRMVITLSDTGNPIPQGMEIFEPFVTENSARTSGGGTGLGLAITKRVIERHGGSITLLSEVPGFTKAFVVKLKCKG